MMKQVYTATYLLFLILVLSFVYVQAENTPPVIQPIADTSIVEGHTLEWLITATDADGDALTMTMKPPDSDPMYLDSARFTDNGDGTATFIFHLGFAQWGVYPISFLASDGTDTDSFLVNLTVIDTNVAPIWQPIPDTSITEGEILNLTVNAIDADGTTPHLSAQGPVNSDFVDNGNGTGTFEFSPNFIQAGGYSVSFLASDDSGLTDTATIQISVIEAGNQPPKLDPIGNKRVIERTTMQITVTAFDPDSTMPQLSVSSLPENATFTDNGDHTGLFVFTPDETQFGNDSAEYPIVFYASDGSATDSERVIITVVGPNDPPVLASIGNKTVTEGDTLTFSISSVDPDGMFPVLSVAPVLENSSLLDNGDGTGVYTFMPSYTQSGVDTVTFYADDGAFIDSETILITVLETGNHAPIFNPVDSPLVVIENDSLLFTVVATDPEGTPVILSMADTLENSTFDDQTGEYAFYPDLTQGGHYTVLFLASDSTDGETNFAVGSLLVYISVMELDTPPVLNPIGGRTIDEGNLLRFSVSGTDIEEGSPRLSVANDIVVDTIRNFEYSFVDNGDGTGLFELIANFDLTDEASTLLHFTFYARDSVDVDSEVVIITVFNVAKDTKDPGLADSLILSGPFWDGNGEVSISAKIWNDSAISAGYTWFSWDKTWLLCDSIVIDLPLRPLEDYGTIWRPESTNGDTTQLFVGFVLYDSTFLNSGYHDYFTAYFSYDTSLYDKDTIWKEGDVFILEKDKVSTGGFAFDKRPRALKAFEADNSPSALDINIADTYVPLANQAIVRAAFNKVWFSVYDMNEKKTRSPGDTLIIDGVNNRFQLRLRLENPKKLSGIQLGLTISSPDDATWTYQPQTGGLGGTTQAISLFDSRMLPPEVVWDETGGLTVAEINVDGTGTDTLCFTGTSSAAITAGLPAGMTDDVLAVNFIPGNVNVGEVKQICFDSLSYGATPMWGYYKDGVPIATEFVGGGCYYVMALNPTDVNDGEQLPGIYNLSQNYPNPFNPMTTIDFNLPKRERVSLIVYNILGQQVRILADGTFEAGEHTVIWDGKDKTGRVVSTGIYLYRIESNGLTETKKMILLK